MKIFKRFLQNRKGLQKLDTKHIPHVPKEDFQKKVKILSFFNKGGLRDLKHKNFEKISPKLKSASKIGY